MGCLIAFSTDHTTGIEVLGKTLAGLFQVGSDNRPVESSVSWNVAAMPTVGIVAWKAGSFPGQRKNEIAWPQLSTTIGNRFVGCVPRSSALSLSSSEALPRWPLEKTAINRHVATSSFDANTGVGGGPM